jgi:hypothetical protein
MTFPFELGQVHIVGLWVCNDRDAHWLCLVYRKENEKILHGECRLHFFADNQTKWYDLDFGDETEEEVIMRVHLTARQISDSMDGPKARFIPIHSTDPNAFIAAVKSDPAFGVRVVPREENA